jgi:hypothetical protein
MRNKKIFENLKVPGPPSELKQKVIVQARRALETGPRSSSFSRKRSLDYILATGIIGCFVFLLFWNPPIPASNSIPISQQDISAIENPDVRAFSARLQYKKRENQQISLLLALEGELL